MGEANDVARTNDSKQLKLVYEQQAVNNVSKRCGMEVQTASDVGETE